MTAPTDTTEKGLEDLIVRSLVEEAGYEQGSNADYDRARALDTAKLLRFLEETQPEELAKVGADAPQGRGVRERRGSLCGGAEGGKKSEVWMRSKI